MVTPDDPSSTPASPADAPSSSANEPAPPANAAATGSSESPRRPRRRRPLWAKFLITLLVVVGLIVIAVQAVLASDLPRVILIDALQKALGMKVEATSVSTGWWGRTEVNDVRLTIPLDEGHFLETKQIRVNHTSLLMIAISGLEIRELQVDQPTVYLRQSASGQWNAANVLEGLTGGGGGNAGGGSAGGGGGGGGRTKLPAIDIRGASLLVTDRASRQSRVGPLDFLGLPDESSPDLVWKYSFQLPNQISITGRTVTGGDWRNEAKIHVTDLKPLLAPFAGDAVPDVKLTARWEGQASGGVQGRIAIDSVYLPGVSARGVIAIAQGPEGKVTVNPIGLDLFTGPAIAGDPLVVLNGGAIHYQGSEIRLDQLIARAGGGAAKLTGVYNPSAGGGELAASWAGLGLPTSLSHDGSLKAKLTQSLTGRVEFHAEVDTQGHLASDLNRKWAGRVVLSGNGPAMNDLVAQLSLPQFTLTGPRGSAPLDGLAVQLAWSDRLGDRPGGAQQKNRPGPGLAIEWARLGDSERLAASGFFLPGSQEWALQFRGSRWPLPLVDHEGLGLTLDVAGEREADGVGHIVHLRNVAVAGAETVLRITGSYVSSKPAPLEVVATINHQPPTTARFARDIGAKPIHENLIWGAMAGTGAVVGTLDPVNLQITGDFQCLGLNLADHPIGDVTARIKGQIDPKHVRLYRDPEGPPLQLLGGHWDVDAVHAFDQEATTFTLNLNNLPLARVGEVFNVTKLTGNATGAWTVFVPTYQDLQNRVRVAGGLVVSNLDFNGFEVETIDARTTIEKGLFRIDPLTVRQGDGVITAKAQVEAHVPRQIEITSLQVGKWPVQLPPATFLTVDASAPLVIARLPDAGAADPAAKKVRFETGPIVVQSGIKVGDIDAGQAQLNLNVDGRVIHVPLLSAKLFGAEAEGQATIPLDSPNDMSVVLSAKRIDPQELSRLAPPLKDLSGSFDLAVSAGRTKRALAAEPWQLDADLVSRDVIYRMTPTDAPATAAAAAAMSAVATQPPPGAPPAATTAAVPAGGIRVGDGRFRVYARFDETFSAERVALADQSGLRTPTVPGDAPPKREGPLPVNTLEIAGGQLTFWGRMVRNENDRGIPGFHTVASHLRIGLRAIDLNQVMQAFKPDNLATPGMVDGSVVLFGSTDRATDTNARRARQAVTEPDFVPRPATDAAAPAGDDFLTSFIKAMQGEAAIELRQSDLANVGWVATLYNMLRLGDDMRAPTGTGQIKLRIENSSAYITAFRYFNRGVEIRAIGDIRQLHKTRDATADLTAYGSIRTLKDVEIPFVRSLVPDIEDILSALQKSGQTVRVTGPLSNLNVEVILFESVGKSLRELLVGDYREATRTP